MSEWIESHSNLPRHPKVKRLARELGVPVIPHAIGYLHALWYFALDFAPGGDLDRHTAEDIAEACGWEGDPRLFLTALVNAHLVDKDLVIHDWDEFNCSHKKRMADAQRQRDKRERERDVTRDKRDSDRDTETSVTQEKRDNDTERQRRKRLRDRENEDLSQDVTVTVTPVTPDRTGQDRTGQELKPSVPSPEATVFGHWKQVMGKNGSTVLDAARKTAIKRALKVLSVEECKKAIDGCRATPHNMGDNDRHTAYNDLTLIFRDAAHWERFIEQAGKRPGVENPDDHYQRLLSAGADEDTARRVCYGN